MTGVTATFHGSYTKIYLQYIDLSNYHCLVAVPGNTYTVGLASGWGGLLAPVPADGSWGAAGQMSAAPFSAVPGLASPGAFFPAFPGLPAEVEDAVMEDAVMEEEPAELPAEEQWAQDAVAAAARDAIFGAAREQLDRAREQVEALRRRGQK